MATDALLFVSNVFMTFAWYGQLKIIQEAITLVVFTGFAYRYMGEALRWNNAASLVCLIGAVAFTFWHA